MYFTRADTPTLRLGDCCRRLGDNNDAWDKFSLCLKSARGAGESGSGFIRKCKQRLRSLTGTAVGRSASQSAALTSKTELARTAPAVRTSRRKGTVVVHDAASSCGGDEAREKCFIDSNSTGASECISDGCSDSDGSSSVDSAFVKSEHERKAAIPCRNWANFGSCQHGSGCHFSHDLAASAAARAPDAPLPPCRNWALGNCKFGRLCHFSHDMSLKK